MYDTKLEDVLIEYGGADIITYMIYAVPGHRDLIILRSGIEDIYRWDYFINLEEIDEDTAKAYDVKRGWKLSFIFTRDIKEYDMAEWISKGLDELRVKYELLEIREVISDV
tara:strand:+ start:2755 stop:3087 length:333 start_codon:yes stop_codon:yes gene_type:complete